VRNLEQDMDTGKVGGGEGRAWCEGNTAKCWVSFFPLTKGPYRIISTDYTGYTVIWTCLDLLFAHREYFWILSRTETISEASKTAAYAAIEAANPKYDYPTQFHFTYQGAGCNYTP